MGDVKRKFATILATDCVGFSKHMLEDEQATFESLNACREIIDSLIEQHGGRIFHTAGDSVLADFASPIETVNCAIKFQEAIQERNETITDKDPRRKLLWRIGIHSDDVIFEKDNVYGNGVNIAARLKLNARLVKFSFQKRLMSWLRLESKQFRGRPEQKTEKYLKRI